MFDWYNRHADQDIQGDHPFLTTLFSTGMSPTQVCVTLPSLTSASFLEFSNKRLHPIRSLVDVDTDEAMKKELRAAFEQFAKDVPNILDKFQSFRSKTSAPTLPKLTIHNHTIGRIPHQATEVRVFFSRCKCKIKKRNECVQHTLGTVRCRDMMLLSHEVAHKRMIARSGENIVKEPTTQKWGFICEAPRHKGGKDDTDQERSRVRGNLEHAITRGEKAHPGFAKEKITLIDWRDAEVCACCGKK
ncbi:uncharacterized protein I303_104322 [Kwoniella dejecticola CBS 10117]|uniref:Uncharacterized protein n=1 Tax=Kwoniella dejecticola CBS 10117 TaxID=1296121 RepID=A0A1A6A5N7_9TREE|nr:uncharacterized protein I303_04704 [Kwoniella dejecticola CBS 10117]OBR85369.1 hypothetical protein I303_04704 [Kwoniella dejecticola CBS 10117]